MKRQTDRQGDEKADRQASTKNIIFSQQLGKAEVLGGQRTFLRWDKPDHHCNNYLKERGEETGSRQHSTLNG